MVPRAPGKRLVVGCGGQEPDGFGHPVCQPGAEFGQRFAGLAAEQHPEELHHGGGTEQALRDLLSLILPPDPV